MLNLGSYYTFQNTNKNVSLAGHPCALAVVVHMLALERYRKCDSNLVLFKTEANLERMSPHKLTAIYHKIVGWNISNALNNPGRSKMTL